MSNLSNVSSPAADVNPRAAWKGERGFFRDLVAAVLRLAKRLFWAGLIVGALMLFAWLVWLMLLAPKRTPVVVMTAAPYAWPLPPNAWAAEDVENLLSLDGETIDLRGDGEPVLTGSDFLDRIDKEVRRHQSQKGRLPLIVWVSLHGVAYGDDSAVYLVPPQSDATDRAGWIHFDELLHRLEAAGAGQNILLVLDSVRMEVNWNTGLVHNHFASRVDELCRQRQTEGSFPEHLSILIPASFDEVSHVSADLSGSVFGHYMQLGLAGAADRSTEFGNQDDWVDLEELYRYVSAEVDWWCRQNRGETQTPILLSSESEKGLRLARCLNPVDLGELVRAGTVGNRPAPSVASSQLDSLWQSYESLREAKRYSAEPIAYRDVEHRLLWLEQLSAAGQGYQSLARRTYRQLESDFEAIEQRKLRLARQRRFIDSAALISGKAPVLPRGLRVHTLPLAEFFGTQDAESLLAARTSFDDFASRPAKDRLSKTRQEIAKFTDSDFQCEHFLQMVDRYQTQTLWQNDELLKKLLRVQLDWNDLSVPRGRDGTPRDLRVHRWNRAAIESADPSRRQAEDRVFVQNQPGLQDAVGQAVSLGDRVKQIVTVAGGASDVCDRSMASALYYANWWADPRRRIAAPNDDLSVQAEIDSLLSQTKELATRLADVPTVRDLQELTRVVESIDQFSQEQVEGTLSNLDSEFEQTQKSLLVDSESNRAELVGELAAVLSAPLGSWQARRDLRDARSRLETRLHQQFEPQDQAFEVTELSETISYSERIAAWSIHPLERALGKDTVDEPDPVTAFGRSLQAPMQERNAEPTIAGRRKIGDQIVQRVRAAAPIWFPMPNDDPIAEQRSVELQSLLQWHARRAMQDFWGPAGKERPFYDLAVEDYCNVVDAMSNVAEGSPQMLEVADLRTTLQASRTFLPGWVKTTADQTIQLDPEDVVASYFTVRSEVGNGFVPPTGIASVLVKGEERRVDVNAVEPSGAVSLPASEESYLVQLPPAVVAIDEELKALTVFRGHEFGGKLDVDKLGGVRVDVHPDRYRYSDVNLTGPWDELSVLFVIDGSASMGEPLVGGSSEEGDAATRIEVARSALQDLLFQLGLRRNVRVGVRAFGHRLGWTVEEPIRPRVRPDYLGQLDENLTPSRDVESVLPLADFDLDTAKSVTPLIDEIKPWGQSPLYLAVQQAMDEFSDADANADRHIIVITDGANYQYIPFDQYTEFPTTDADVRDAFGRSQVPVHILGLGMDRADQAEEIRRFDQLSRETGGRFQALTNSTDLAQAMRQLLSPGMYRLSAAEADTRPDVRSTLGAPVRVAPAPDEPELFLLQYEGKELVDNGSAPAEPQPLAIETVTLEGGESMQLYVDVDGSDIFAHSFEEDVVVSSELETAGGIAADHVLRIHRPKQRRPGTLGFAVSWQRHDPDVGATEIETSDRWRVTRRPSSIWIEIQPLSPAREPIGDAYAFYDTSWVPGQPVPLINVEAAEWPAKASFARISAWSKSAAAVHSMELLPPALEQGGAVQGVAEQESAALSQTKTDASGTIRTIAIDPKSEASVEALPGVYVHVDRFAEGVFDGVGRRRFVIRFDDPGIPVTGVKLVPSPQSGFMPTRIVRQFDSERRLSVHTFYYDSVRETFPDEIEISDRAFEINGAWVPSVGPIEVFVPDSGALLPVGDSVAP